MITPDEKKRREEKNRRNYHVGQLLQDLSSSNPNLTRGEVENLEWSIFTSFGQKHSEEEFRGPLGHLIPYYQELNDLYFDGKLSCSHLGIGSIHASAWVAEYSPTTIHGAKSAITVDERIAFSTHPMVIDSWPAEGLVRFLEDGILRAMVQQFVLTIAKVNPKPHHQFARALTDKANEIGLQMGLAKVVDRNRNRSSERLPLFSQWPHNVRLDRDGSYYAPAVDWVPRWHGNSRRRVDPFEALMSYFLRLANAGNVTAIEVLTRNYLDRRKSERKPTPARVEAGEVDVEGNVTEDVRIQRNWLTRNDGCVAKLAQAIVQERQFDMMPILGDALQDAGCHETVLLQHCRLPTSHTSDCFVLRLLLAAEEERRIG